LQHCVRLHPVASVIARQAISASVSHGAGVRSGG
jgi:hypothetical protein